MMPLLTRYPQGPIFHEPSELDSLEPKEEDVWHIATARVAFADYEVLQHDFAELTSDALAHHNPDLVRLAPSERAQVEHAIIDEWLLANAAFVSVSQACQAVVNTPIVTDGGVARAHRPRTYGRALVIPVQNIRPPSAKCHWNWGQSPGLLDLKGVGVSPDRIPSHRKQSNGLEYLATALSDLLVKKAIDEVCARWAPSIWTVPVYAVLDLGFDIRDEGSSGQSFAAGVHVRRAHRRQAPDGDEGLRDELAQEVETMLRRHGMTTASIVRRLHVAERDGRVELHIGDTPWPLTLQETGVCLALLSQAGSTTLDRPDVQFARDSGTPAARAQLIDFGAIRIEEKFLLPFTSATRLRLDQVKWPGDQDFRQPDPRCCLPLSSWNRRALSMLCGRLAKEFRQNSISREELRTRLEQPLCAVVEQWPHPTDEHKRR